MLDPNAKIEQFIYTACGDGRNGKFDVWSASSDELRKFAKGQAMDQILKIIRMGYIVLKFDKDGKPKETTFDAQYMRERVLKEGAKPSGLFRKSYKEDDYEYVNRIIRNEIELIQETAPNLTATLGYEYDFRQNEENAPFRIAYTKLLDGRLLVCRLAELGLAYTQNPGTRMGNYFAHAYIFPAGTEISDIDLSRLHFEIGLDAKYWSENPEPAPKLLPELTINELYRTSNQSAQQKPTESQQQRSTSPQQGHTPTQPRPVQQSQTQTNSSQTQQNTSATQQSQQPTLLSTDELIALFKESEFSTDRQVRLESKKKFNAQVKLGANVPEMLNTIYEQNIEKLNNGQEMSAEDELIINELEQVYSPFSSIFEHTERYYEQREQLRSGDCDDLDAVNTHLQTSKNYIKSFISEMDLEQLMAVALSTKKYIVNRERYNLLQKNKKLGLGGSVTLSADDEIKFSSADMLYRTARTMHEKKISFDEQRVIS